MPGVNLLSGVPFNPPHKIISQILQKPIEIFKCRSLQVFDAAAFRMDIVFSR